MKVFFPDEKAPIVESVNDLPPDFSLSMLIKKFKPSFNFDTLEILVNGALFSPDSVISEIDIDRTVLSVTFLTSS